MSEQASKRGRPDEPPAGEDQTVEVGKTPVPEDRNSGGEPPKQRPRIVGIGASAGGLEPLRHLFKLLPPDTGMCFVVVVHLLPEADSALSAILARETKMKVMEITDGMRPEPNRVFVIPPGFNVVLSHGLLRTEPRGENRLAVDRFFVSLARETKERAIAVILSGGGSDGSAGVEVVREAGGIALSQDPETARHDGMPTHAIATGYIDASLDIAGMAEQLVRLSADASPPGRSQMEELRDSTCRLLLRQTGNNFSLYKPASVDRRIQRRMSLCGVHDPIAYLALLENDPKEVEALFRELLINVTSFFRDPEAFESLIKRVFPDILRLTKKDDQPVRIWVPGCATGEEVYSLAMGLVEAMDAETSSADTRVQIFGSDLDPDCIDQARQGVYPASIVDSVSPGRLSRFFRPVAEGFKISRQIRGMCVFSEQNVTKDPPFSRMDLVSCRNLLIYFNHELQSKVIRLFHYALQPDGFLVLGGSESIGVHANHFAPYDAKNKIFRRKSAWPSGVRFSTPVVPGMQTRANEPAMPIMKKFERRLEDRADDMILERHGPAGILVDQDLKIIQFRGETGEFLQPSQGAATLSLLKLARKDLLIPLRSSILEAGRSKSRVRNVQEVFSETGSKRVLLEVSPIVDHSTGKAAFLILFLDAGDAEESVSEPGDPTYESVPTLQVQRLEAELVETREYLQALLESQEAANEELQSASEEIQSTNEELQSANEELETAKEELQSANEELLTLNEELEIRNQELTATNSDLVNLLASVDIPVVIVREDLTIRHFTQKSKEVLNLIDADIGRPITDIHLGLQVDHLDRQIYSVVETLRPFETEVRHESGRDYFMSIRPYRTSDNRIAGAVLSLMDTTAAKATEKERRLAAVIRNADSAIIVLSLQGIVEAWNASASAMYGYTEAEAVGMSVSKLLPNPSPSFSLKRSEFAQASDDQPRRSTRLTRDGLPVHVWMNVMIIRGDAGEPEGFVSVERAAPEDRDAP